MATLGDIRPVLKSYGTWPFLKRLWQQIDEDDIFVWASALAYSWLFSVFPFLILILSLIPYLPAKVKAKAYDEISSSITQALGKEAHTINDNITNVMQHPHTGWLGIGLVLTIWIASGGMAMTMSALDRCYDIKEATRPFYKQRALAIALTLGVTIGVLVLVILLPIGTAVGNWLKSTGGISAPLSIAFEISRYILSILFALIVLSIIYYFGPNIRQRFRLLSPGGVFSACVWILSNIGFRFYVDRYARYDQTYGSVGGTAILLLFFYIDALVLLIGAEINSEIDFERLGVPSGSTDFTGAAHKKASALPEIAKEL